jgi:hypothetical protein
MRAHQTTGTINFFKSFVVNMTALQYPDPLTGLGLSFLATISMVALDSIAHRNKAPLFLGAIAALTLKHLPLILSNTVEQAPSLSFR